ncbi:Neurotrimin [Eufriesea mexicana]|uniref:Neurotrimin n=1 Tax=Eufriesea mexicana TaxID=516756 RepID=A0A310SQT7_9HYME|nr:Neurotrimin [Eufriesea mexicana]
MFSNPSMHRQQRGNLERTFDLRIEIKPDSDCGDRSANGSFLTQVSILARSVRNVSGIGRKDVSRGCHLGYDGKGINFTLTPTPRSTNNFSIFNNTPFTQSSVQLPSRIVPEIPTNYPIIHTLSTEKQQPTQIYLILIKSCIPYQEKLTSPTKHKQSTETRGKYRQTIITNPMTAATEVSKAATGWQTPGVRWLDQSSVWCEAECATAKTVRSEGKRGSRERAYGHLVSTARKTNPGWPGGQGEQGQQVVPPNILDYSTSTDMVVAEGSKVTLHCEATGSPEPSIIWRREDNQLILLPNGEEATSIEGPNFNISKVNRLHMGFYLCIASNGVPPSVSKRIMLTVQFPPMIWVQNQLVGAQEGQPLTLECLSEAYPKSINYWTRDKDEIVPQGGKYEPILQDNAYKVHMKLTISSVNASDFGSYKCVSRNALGDTDGTIEVYPIRTSNSNGSNTSYKGKLRHNSRNDIFEGNQDMLKERDLKLRGRKETSGNEEDDYDDSGATTSVNSFSLILALVTFIVYLHHHPQLRTLHPA